MVGLCYRIDHERVGRLAGKIDVVLDSRIEFLPLEVEWVALGDNGEGRGAADSSGLGRGRCDDLGADLPRNRRRAPAENETNSEQTGDDPRAEHNDSFPPPGRGTGE